MRVKVFFLESLNSICLFIEQYFRFLSELVLVTCITRQRNYQFSCGIFRELKTHLS